MNSIKKLNEVLFLINKKHTGNLCRYVFCVLRCFFACLSLMLNRAYGMIKAVKSVNENRDPKAADGLRSTG